jgi:predicted transport protein
LAQAAEPLKEMYQALEDRLLAMGDDVEKKVLKHYIAYKRIKNFACVEIKVQNMCLIVNVKCPPTEENLIPGFTADVTNVGHLGTGNWRSPSAAWMTWRAQRC